MPKKVVIIGGGAAGFFCAANIQHPHLEVILLEKTGKLLSKVKVSGGGRCNVTNGKYETNQDFATAYPRGKNLMKKSLNKFSFTDTFQWFEQRGVSLKTESDGRVFPVTNDSQSIIDCLIAACEKNKVQIKTNTAVTAINAIDNQYEIHTKEAIIIADFVVIATGGYPKLSQYEWLENFQLKIENPVPSLFTFNLPKHPIIQLMGVAVPNVHIKILGEKLTASGPLMITHWGLSGPCVLKLSAWGARLLSEKDWHFGIHINWLESYTEETLRMDMPKIRATQGNKLLSQKNPFGLPARLWDFLLMDAGIAAEQRWSELSSKNQNRLIVLLTQYECLVKGKTTFKEEFVTAGGVQLSQIQSQSMQYKERENVYVIGEAMDVDGITGGFNFQNAWTSGYIAAKDILSKV